MLSIIFAIALKEIQVLLQDRGSLAVLFLLPLLLASMMGSINRSVQGMVGEGEGEATGIPVFLVNQDEGFYGEQLVEILTDVTALDVLTMADADEADLLVAEGERIAAIIIPTGFSEDVDAYRPTEIKVVLDPVQEDFGSLVVGIVNNIAAVPVLQGEIKYGVHTVIAESGAFDDAPPEYLAAVEAQSYGVIMAQLSELEENAAIAVTNEIYGGVEAEEPWDPFAYYTPGFTTMFAFFLVGTVAVSLLQEKEVGSMRRLLAAPMSREAIILGKMQAYMFVVVMQVVVLFTISHFAYDMALGNPLALASLTLALGLTAASLGMMVAALASSTEQADSVGMILGFTLAALGGCLYPVHNAGGFIGILSRLTPHAHALLGYNLILEKDGLLVDVLPYIGILLVFSAVFFVIARLRFKFN